MISRKTLLMHPYLLYFIINIFLALSISTVSRPMETTVLVEEKEPSAETAVLHWACAVGKRDIFNILPPSIDIHERYNNRRAIDVAAENGHADMVDDLVKKGAEIDSERCARLLAQKKDCDSEILEESSLHQLASATRHNKEELCKAFHLAAQSSQTALMKLLLHKGAPLLDNTRQKEHALYDTGFLDLHAAILKEHIAEAIPWALAYICCDISLMKAYKWTMLHSAVTSGKREVVSWFITKFPRTASDVNSTDINGFSPLHLAVILGYEDIVALLLTLNIKTRHQKDLQKLTPLHWASVRGCSTETYLSLKVFESEKDLNGNTCLHILASFGKADLIDEVVRKLNGNDRTLLVNVLSDNHVTPLCCAAYRGHTRAIACLLQWGANLNPTQSLSSPSPALHWAVRGERDDTIAFLIKQGALVGAFNHGGDTALHMAVKLRLYTAMLALVRKAPESVRYVNCRDYPQGETPLDYAKKLNDERAISIISGLHDKTSATDTTMSASDCDLCLIEDDGAEQLPLATDPDYSIAQASPDLKLELRLAEKFESF